MSLQGLHALHPVGSGQAKSCEANKLTREVQHFTFLIVAQHLLAEGGCPAGLNLMLVLEYVHAGRAGAIVQQGPPIHAMCEYPHQAALASIHTPSNCIPHTSLQHTCPGMCLACSSLETIDIMDTIN